MMNTTCKHPDGCDRRVKARGWCRPHADRIRKGGDPGPAEIRQKLPLGRPCSVACCDKPVTSDAANGMCGMHYQRFRKHGSADVVAKGGASLPLSQNPNWSGDAPTYSATHLRLRRNRGLASSHPCVDCGQIAAHWSYDNSAPSELTDPATGLRYSAEMSHYFPRCVPCHRRYDITAARTGALLTGERP